MQSIKGENIMPQDYVITLLNFENMGEVGVFAILKDNKIFIPYEIYEKYKNADNITYDYATTRGSCHNNILPLETNDRETYWYKNDAYIDFTDKLFYKNS